MRMGRRRGPPIEDPAHVAGGEPVAPAVDEQGGAGLASAYKVASGACDPGVDRIGRGFPERRPALLGPLAPHDNGSTGEVDIVDIEPAQLRDAQPAAVEQLENSVVAAVGRVV